MRQTSWARKFLVVLSVLLSVLSSDMLGYVGLDRMHCTTGRVDFHREVYLDDDFSEEDVTAITEALTIWRSRTNGVVDMRVVGRVPHRTFLAIPIFAKGPSVKIFRVSSFEQVFWPRTILGVTGLNSIILMVDRMDGYNMRVSVALHEFGHLIGLEHDAEDSSALMYPTCNEQCEHPKITAADLSQLCGVIKRLEQE